MIIFNEIKTRNFRNIKYVTLENLRDLNILIGPNNCGKTNMLELINYFSKLNYGRAYGYLCPQCNHFAKINKLEGVSIYLNNSDFYLKKDPRKSKIEIRISLNKTSIEKLIPRVLAKQENAIKGASCTSVRDEIILESDYTSLHAKHLSPFIHSDILDEIKK